MALAYDTKARIPATALSTTTSAPTANYTCGANAGVLVVMICWSGQTGRTGGAPTYNGVALTEAASRQGVTETSVEMWYLLSPPTGSSLEIIVPNDGGLTMWVYVASATVASGNTCAYDASGSNASTGSNPLVNLTVVATATIVFAVVATGDNGFSPTARTGTSLYEEDIAAYGGAAQYYVKSGAGSWTMSWTEGTSDDYGAIAGAFKEVSAAKIFAGTAQLTSATPTDADMSVTRLLAGIAEMTSLTPSAGSAITRNLNRRRNYWPVAGVTKPQHYWPFKETGDYSDQGSAGGLDLSAQGSGNSFGAEGLVLNGSGYAQLSAANDDLNAIGATWSMIAEFEESVISYRALFAISNDAVANSCYETFVPRSDIPSIYTFNGSTQDNITSGPAGTGVIQLVWVYSGGNCTLYKNGEFVKTESLDAPQSNNTFYFAIGALSDGSYKFSGTIKRVGILKGTAWSADDVADIYACLTDPSWPVHGATKPQHYWPFRETGDYSDRGSVGGITLSPVGAPTFNNDGLVIAPANFAEWNGTNEDINNLGDTFSILFEGLYTDSENYNSALTIGPSGAYPYEPFYLIFYPPTSNLIYRMGDGATYNDAARFVLPAASVNFQAVYTQSGTTGKIYFNGLQAGADFTGLLTPDTTQSNLLVGAGHVSGYTGTIKRIGILKGTAWSADDVAAIYAASQPMVTSAAADMTTITPTDADLLVEALKIFAGTAELSSTTPAVVLSVTRVLAGLAELTSLTPAAAIAVTRVLAGIAELASVTPDDVELTISVLAKIFAGTAALETSTPTAVLTAIRAIAGLADITSVTPTVAMVVTRVLSGLAEISSLTPNAVVAVTRILAGIAEMSSNTPTASAAITRVMAGIAEITSATPTSALVVTRLLGGLASLISVTPDDASLTIAGIIIMAGIAAMQSNTADAAMAVTRVLAGASTMTSFTPDSILTVVRVLAGIAELTTVTPASILKIVRAMVGAAAMQTLTPSAASTILRVLAGVAAVESATPDDAYLASTIIFSGLASLQSLTPDNVNLDTGEEPEALVDYILSIRRRRRAQ